VDHVVPQKKGESREDVKATVAAALVAVTA